MKGIKVSEFSLFPYKNVLSNNRFEVIFKVPENYQDKKIERVYKESDIEHYLGKQDEKKGNKGKKNQKFKAVSVNQEEEEIIDYDSALLQTADTIINKIRKEDYSKYNRSAMVLKMSSLEDKSKIVTNWTRLFGLNFKNFKNIKFEEGYCKTTVVVGNIPVGCQAK